MSNINKVILCGHLTGDVKTKDVKNTKVSVFTIAVNRKSRDKVETLYIDVQAWDKQSDIASQFLKKGALAGIEGRIKLDTWQDKTTGQNRTKHSIHCESIILFNSKDAEESGQMVTPQPLPQATQQRPQPRPAQQPSKPVQNNQGTVQFDDDLPF